MAVDRNSSAIYSAHGSRILVARLGGITPGGISIGRRRFAGKSDARVHAMGIAQRDYMARFCVANVSADGNARDVDGRLGKKEIRYG